MSDSLTTISNSNSGKNARLSYILILVSSFTWVSGFIYPNENNIKPWEINMLKGYPLAILCLLICRYKNYSILFKSRKQFILVQIRNLLFLIHDLTVAWMQYKLPLPIVHNINNSMSIFVMLIELKQ